MDKKTENLIINYFANRLSDEEAKELSIWLEVSDNESVFKKYIELNYSIEESKSKLEDTSKLWEDISSSSYKKSKIIYLKYWKYAVAASLVVFLSLGILISKFKVFSSTESFSSYSKIEPGTDRAILTLENGKEIELKSGHSYATANAKGDESGLFYLSKTSDASNNDTKQSYNYITVPRGGKFFIKLSDDTEIWLNSESKLKYPVSFKEGENRQVELVYGEAYFDVSPSTQHNGSKFKVKNEQQLVEVLGTEFNIKAYKDETEILTTLVEGSIAMNNDNHTAILLPGEQSKLISGTNGFEVYRVDVADYVLWREGKFSFTNKTLSEIVKVLSRWYNIEILITDEEIKNIRFTGVLSRNESIIEILETIQITNNINYIVNENNTIITIKKKG